MSRLSPLVQNMITGLLFTAITILIAFLGWISLSVIDLRDRVIVTEVRQDKMEEQVDTIVKEIIFLMHGNSPR